MQIDSIKLKDSLKEQKQAGKGAVTTGFNLGINLAIELVEMYEKFEDLRR